MTRCMRSQKLLVAVVVNLIVGEHYAACAGIFSRFFDVTGTSSGNAHVSLPAVARADYSHTKEAFSEELIVGEDLVSFEDGVPFANLVNHGKIPLVGLSVSNIRPEFVGALVAEAVLDDKKTILFDTSRVSDNEHLIAGALVHAVDNWMVREEHQGKLQVHVVTKVWYTHLGYERTKASVLQSLQDLSPALRHDKIDLKLHVLLQWPQCYDNISWMDCAKEEASLPQHIKELGPDPTRDPENAWVESWKSLEDLYLSGDHPIVSIGLAHFHLHDLEAMNSFARVQPHLLQVSVWSLLYDPHFVDHCHHRGIHLQVTNALSSTIETTPRRSAPRAYRHLEQVAREVASHMSAGNKVTSAQVILAWLIQHGVSVLPSTTRLAQLKQHSAVSLLDVPGLNSTQVDAVAHAVEACLSGEDMDQDVNISVSFHVVSKDIMLYWKDHQGNEVHVAYLQQGETFNETTYPTHVYRAYDALNMDNYEDHEIRMHIGQESMDLTL